MELNYYLGTDISKNTIDLCLRDPAGVVAQEQCKNTPKEIRAMGRKLQKHSGFSWANTLVCLEYTGIYTHHLVNYLVTMQAAIWIERALQIKNSLGMVRGKNDQVDAIRIAEYAFRFQDKARLWIPPRSVIAVLKKLSTIRAQLIKTKDQLEKSLNEAKLYEDKSLYQLEKTFKAPLIKQLQKKIESVDNSIKSTLLGDKHLKQLTLNITSVVGVGPVTATAIIITTNEFKNITEAKKFACYSGTVPFANTSGTSTRGREKVSHLANKKVKTLLHMCALSAIHCPGDMQKYYERKISEGKNKMSVINAVRNKLIHRIFSVVKANRKYEKNYLFSFG